MTRRRFHYRPPPANHPLFLTPTNIGAPEPAALAVDLRPHMMPPRDQGQEGCCSGFSTAALREAICHIVTGIFPLDRLSPAYLYARTRMTEGTFPADAGATVADEIQTLVNYGACYENLLPYSGSATEGPTPQADCDAAAWRAFSPQPVSRDPIWFERVLAQNQPIVFGMPVYESFENALPASCIVPIPNPAKEKLLGGHAMLIAGYDRNRQVLIVKNSWGTAWGDSGYCYIPYAMVNSFYEAWTVGLQNQPNTATLKAA